MRNQKTICRLFSGIDKRVVSKRVVLADVPPERKLERGYIRMFPQNENRNGGTFAGSPRTKTGTRVRLPKPPLYEIAHMKMMMKENRERVRYIYIYMDREREQKKRLCVREHARERAREPEGERERDNKTNIIERDALLSPNH